MKKSHKANLEKHHDSFHDNLCNLPSLALLLSLQLL